MIVSGAPFVTVIRTVDENYSRWVRLLVTVTLVASVISLSLVVERVYANYAVSVSFFWLFTYCIFMLRFIRLHEIMVFLAFVSYILANAILYNSRLNDVEFLKSFLLTCVALYVYITSLSPLSPLRNCIDFPLLIKAALIPIIAFEWMQVASSLLLQDTSLWFLLDPVSISTAQDIGRFKAANALGYIRPVSFYYEPSYLGTILLILLVIQDAHIRSRMWRAAIVSSILLTLSSTAIAFSLLYLLIYYRVQIGFFISRYWYIGLLVLYYLFDYSLIGELFFLSRLNEVLMPGTSGWFRVVMPFLELQGILSDNYTGIPLGQSSIVFDNSFYLLFLYFGVFTPCLLYFWCRIVRTKLPGLTIFGGYFAAVLALLWVNGAIFTVESVFLLFLLNYALVDCERK